jgi:hypothetical protein
MKSTVSPSVSTSHPHQLSEEHIESAAYYLVLHLYYNTVERVENAIVAGQPDILQFAINTFEVYEAARDVVQVLQHDGHSVIHENRSPDVDVFHATLSDLFGSLTPTSKALLKQREFEQL